MGFNRKHRDNPELVKSALTHPYTRLTPDLVIAAVESTGRFSDARILALNSYENRVYQVGIEDEVPVIDSAAEIATLGCYEDFLFAIYPRQGGRAPELDNLDHLHQLGRFIGRIHALAQGFPFQHRLSLSVEQTSANVDYLLEAEFMPRDLEAAYRAISAEILAAIDARRPDTKRFRQISLHGDCHRGNVLWRDDCPHFVDFDDAISGPAI